MSEKKKKYSTRCALCSRSNDSPDKYRICETCRSLPEYFKYSIYKKLNTAEKKHKESIRIIKDEVEKFKQKQKNSLLAKVHA